jgi:hypothetical protein
LLAAETAVKFFRRTGAEYSDDFLGVGPEFVGGSPKLFLSFRMFG